MAAGGSGRYVAQGAQTTASEPVAGAPPRVTLPEGAVSRYRIAQGSRAGALSTLEAIVQALEILEAPTCLRLLRPFEALIEGQIEAMGADTYQRNHGDKTV